MLLGIVALGGLLDFVPFQSWDQNSWSISLSVVSATVSDSYLPGSQTLLTQMGAWIGGCPGLY